MNAAATISLGSLAVHHTRNMPREQRYVMASFLRRLHRELEACVEEPNGKLCVSLPPRHSKTSSLKYLICRYLGRNPHRRVIFVTHSGSFADEVGEACLETMAAVAPCFGLSCDPNQAKSEWSIDGHTGGLRSIGWGKAILGAGADLVVVDDPYQDLDSVDNIEYSNKFLRWFRLVLLGRLEPKGSVIVNSARVGQEDVIGQLVAEGYPHHNFPAIDEDGEPLWPQRWSKEDLDAKRKAVGPRAWAAQWQGEPKPEGSLLFDEGWLNAEYVTQKELEEIEKHATIRRARGFDLAASTRKQSDFLASARIAEIRVFGSDGLPEVFYLLEDVRRVKREPGNVLPTLKFITEMDTERTLVCVEQEPGASGKIVVSEIKSRLRNKDVVGVRPIGKKERRWDSLIAAYARGAVFQHEDLCRSAEYREYLKELAAAPHSKHDDCLDAVALAFNALATEEVHVEPNITLVG